MRRHDSPWTEPGTSLMPLSSQRQRGTLRLREPARAVHRYGSFEISPTRVKHVIRFSDRATLLPIALSVGSMLLLSGCGGNVEGKMLHAPETWTGDTSGSIAGNGSITLESNRGTRCEGP